MRGISIRLEENPPWMAGLGSPDNSRCQETTVPVGTRLSPAGHLLAGEGSNYQGLVWWFRKYQTPERSVSLKPVSYSSKRAPEAALPLGCLYLLLDFPPKKNFKKYM